MILITKWQIHKNMKPDSMVIIQINIKREPNSMKMTLNNTVDNRNM